MNHIPSTYTKFLFTADWYVLQAHNLVDFAFVLKSREGSDDGKFFHQKVVLFRRNFPIVLQYVADGIITLLQNGIANARNLTTGCLGVINWRMVFRPTSRNFYKHVSFLFVDCSSLFAFFLVSGKTVMA